MDNCADCCVPNEDDYESLLAFLKREPMPKRQYYGLYEFHDSRKEDVPPLKPACKTKCWTSGKGLFFQAEGTKGTWEYGDASIKDNGEEFALEPESIWHISRLCSVMKFPSIRTGISRLYDFLMFLRGMDETLPFNWGDPFAVEVLTHDTLSALVLELGECIDDREIFVKLKEKYNDSEHLRKWRVAFRECLLFTHPEMGLSYAATMGSINLFGFKTLLRKDWWWRGDDEGLNSFQIEHQSDDLLQILRDKRLHH